MVICLGYCIGIKGIGRDDISARVQIGQINGLNDFRLGQIEQIVIALSHPRVKSASIAAAKTSFVQLISLDQRTHRPI